MHRSDSGEIANRTINEVTVDYPDQFDVSFGWVVVVSRNH